MITKFIKGRYYKYTGSIYALDSSTSFLLKGWHKCLQTGNFPCDCELEGSRAGVACYMNLWENIIERGDIQLEFDFDVDINKRKKGRPTRIETLGWKPDNLIVFPSIIDIEFNG